MVSLNHNYKPQAEYSPVSTITIGTLVVIGLAYSLKMSFKTRMVKVVFCLLIWCIINALICPNPNIPTFKVLGFVSLWESMFFLFYYIIFHNCNFVKNIKLFFVIILLINSSLFWISHGYRNLSDFSVTSIGNNVIFYMFTLIPFILLIKNRKWQLLLMIFVSVLVVVSYKRSAIIGMFLILTVFIYFSFLKSSRNMLQNIFITIFGVSLFVSILFVANRFTDGISAERLSNLQEDGGSGRLSRWSKLDTTLKTTYSPGDWIKGKGFRFSEIAMNKRSGTAHNDFLEVLCDYGLIGLSLYVYFHLLVLKRMIFLIRIKSEYRLSYISSYIIFFVMSMVSHLIIYPTYFIYLAIYWGMMEAICVQRYGNFHLPKKFIK